jgi:hypothetical protein
VNAYLARVFKCSGKTSEDLGEYSSNVMDYDQARAAASRTRPAAFMGLSEHDGAQGGRK